MALITNAQIAAEALLYGLTPTTPLLQTRDNSDPNEATQTGFVDAQSNDYFLSYEQLTSDDIETIILNQLIGDYPDRVAALKTAVAAFAVDVAALTEPYDYADYRVIVDGLREFTVLKGYY